MHSWVVCPVCSRQACSAFSPSVCSRGTGFFEVVVLGFGFAFALVVVGDGLVVATTEGATAGAGCVVEVSVGGATGGDAGVGWSHPARAKAATATVAKSTFFMPDLSLVVEDRRS
jgi:hypothetical protein